MAGLVADFPKHFRLLDPGAGIGALTAAVCARILDLRSPRLIEVCLIENDPAVIPFLEENMRNCRWALLQAGHRLSYTIHVDDFLLKGSSSSGHASLFDDEEKLGQFDFVVMNPPYFKIAVNSQYARQMPALVHGQPNIYALFLAQAAQLLRAGGELVAITPRSFCNGLYFRGFRKWFFERMGLDRIHLFESRTDPFQEANILQESIITVCHRLGKSSATVGVSTSFGRNISEKMAVQSLPVSKVIDDSWGDSIVRVPGSPTESKILDVVEAWPHRFSELGLQISTGPVVLFRTRKYLLHALNGADTAPLLLPHNVTPFKTIWSLKRKNKPAAFRVCPGSLRHLVATRNYVLLRRFSSKEERRRLTASCVFDSDQPHAYLALENHLNYVYHARRELTVDETHGIMCLFNSRLLDRYFRIMSGNTQVNATEIRAARFPDLAIVSRIGNRVRQMGKLQPEDSELIVFDELQVNGDLQHYLTDL